MLGEALVIAASFCWAVGANFYKGSLRKADPISLNLLRSSAAAVFLLIAALISGKMGYFLILDGASAMCLVGGALAGWAIGDTLYFLGLKWIGVSRAVPLTYAYPLFMIPLSILFLNEPLTANIILGTIAIVSAVWLISKSGEDSSHAVSAKMRLGVVASIVAAFCWAVGATIFKLMMKTFDPIFIAFFKMLIILPFLAGYISISSGGFAQLSSLERHEILMAVAGGIIAVGFGDMIYLIGLNLTQANIAAPLGASTPIFAAAIAVAFLKEKPNLKVILGILLTVIGAALLIT